MSYRLVVALACVLSCVGLLAACGGDDPAKPNTPTSDTRLDSTEGPALPAWKIMNML